MEEIFEAEGVGKRCEPELLILRDALTFADGAITPDGVSYVHYHEDNHIAMDRPWVYIPDTKSWAITWVLQDVQLEQLVLFSQQPCWLPASNVIFEW